MSAGLELKVGPQTFGELEHKRDVARDEAQAHEREYGECEETVEWRRIRDALDKALAQPLRLLLEGAPQAAEVATEIRNAASIASDDPTERSGQSIAVQLRKLEQAIRAHYALILDKLDVYHAPEAAPRSTP